MTVLDQSSSPLLKMATFSFEFCFRCSLMVLSFDNFIQKTKAHPGFRHSGAFDSVLLCSLCSLLLLFCSSAVLVFPRVRCLTPSSSHFLSDLQLGKSLLPGGHCHSPQLLLPGAPWLGQGRENPHRTPQALLQCVCV